MTWRDWVLVGSTLVWVIFYLMLSYESRQHKNSIRSLNVAFSSLLYELQQYKQVREKLYQKLADPQQVESDFEKSARRREMRDANRTTLPRPDAGPVAKVHRPPLRNKPPAGFRPSMTNKPMPEIPPHQLDDSSRID